MGWRDRDYAKWTDEERRRFYGSRATLPQWDRADPTTHHGWLRPGAGVAVIVSAFIAMGQLPFRHPLIPAFRFLGSASSAPSVVAPVGQIIGPSTATLGSTLSLHGSAPPGDEPVRIDGSYDGGRTWRLLTTIESSAGTYTAEIPMSQKGELALKIMFADGSSAAGSILVQ